MTSLAHISDLHFGKALPSRVEMLLADLHSVDPDLIVVTGDLTQSGRRREFAQAQTFLRKLPAPHLVVPGNHDMPVRNLPLRFLDPLRRFRNYISSDLEPILTAAEVMVVGLNSARHARLHWDWSRGAISRAQSARIASVARNHHAAQLRIVALHHPLLYSGCKAGARLVDGAGVSLPLWAEAGVDVVLHGHAHLPRAQLVAAGNRYLIVLQSGTSLGVRMRGEPGAYNLVTIQQPNRLAVTVRAQSAHGYESAQSLQFVRRERGWHSETAPSTSSP